MTQHHGAPRLLDLRPGEGARFAWAFAWFFLLLGSYYVLRPVREMLGVAPGRELLNWLFLGTLAGVVLLHPPFAAIATRWPRRVFVPLCFRFFLANLLLLYALLLWSASPAADVAVLGGPLRDWIGRLFFVWLTVFVVFAISIFWSLLVDLFDSEQGKRLFGAIAAGGTAGGLVGAWIAGTFVSLVGVPQLLLVSAALLLGAERCATRLARTPARHHPEPSLTRRSTVASARDLYEGARLVLRSPYLLAICAFMLLFTVSASLLYFHQATLAVERFDTPAARTRFFARIDFWVNATTLALQLLLTARVLGVLGVGATLALLPLVTLAGFTALAVAPVIGVLLVVQVARRSTEFALAKPAREILYTVVPYREKYAAKNFVDTFVYRAGDVVGALADRGLTILGLGVAQISLLFVPIALGWAALSVTLGRWQRRRAAAREPNAASGAEVEAEAEDEDEDREDQDEGGARHGGIAPLVPR